VIRERLNEYLRMLGVLSAKATSRAFYPVIFDITSTCNLKCKHCYWQRGDKPPVLTFDQWQDTFSRYRNQGFVHAILSGGEPALNMEVVLLANRLFPILVVATNGLIRIPTDVDHTLLISLDGTEKTHDTIRASGSFRRILDNYENDKRVLYRMTINSLNYKEIADVTRAALQNNVRGISFLGHGAESPNDPLRLSASQLDEVKATLLAIKKQYGRFIYLTPRVIDSMLYSKFANDCKLKEHSVALAADGTRKKCTVHNMDCANCKCVLPAIAYNYATDPRTFLLGLKFY
jgi:MoaA/NifB/PqqE/SkfB family radical SAM enzyme